MDNGVFIERRDNGNWYVIASGSHRCYDSYPVLAIKATLDEAQDWCTGRDYNILDVRL